MGLIFYFSSKEGDSSTDMSDAFSFHVAEFFLGRSLTIEEKDYYWKHVEIPVRKSAHFAVYCLLGILMISFLKEFLPLNSRAIILSILFVFLYACSDEIHQLFVVNRSGEIFDVLLDTVGGLVGCFLYYFIYQRRRKFNEQKKAVS